MGRWQKVVVSACLFCEACHTSSSYWRVVSLQTDEYRGVRLTSSTPLLEDGITLEITYRDLPYPHLESALQVHAQPVPPYKGNRDNQAQVWMKVDNDTVSFLAHRREGGYRLTLPINIQDMVIAALRKGCAIKWFFEGYEGTIEASGFQEAFKRVSTSPTGMESLLKKFKW